MTDKDKSDKILQNLAQVQEVIDDVKEQVHRIQRETPDSVPRRFRVYGRRPFPIDMLRYDNCVPNDEPDSRAIEESFEPERYESGPGNSTPNAPRLFVTLRKLSQGDPNYARWASWGWKVET